MKASWGVSVDVFDINALDFKIYVPAIPVLQMPATT